MDQLHTDRPSQASDTTDDRSGEMYHRIGAITRQLHDALQELGFAEKLKGTVDELPDAQSRLTYIARLTGEAAEKVLNSVDEAKARQSQIVQISRLLESLFPAKPALAEQLQVIRQCGEMTDQHLTDIMMAQDFHDLTGQVISRVVKLAATIEDQLLQLLVDVAPPTVINKPTVVTASASTEYTGPRLEGPVVDTEGRDDVATSQQDVDDLLASLGF